MTKQKTYRTNEPVYKSVKREFVQIDDNGSFVEVNQIESVIKDLDNRTKTVMKSGRVIFCQYTPKQIFSGMYEQRLMRFDNQQIF